MDPTTVDTRGTFCPVPILELARAARRLPAGAEVLLLATDSGMCADLQAWCAATGHELLALDSAEGVHQGRVRLKADHRPRESNVGG